MNEEDNKALTEYLMGKPVDMDKADGAFERLMKLALPKLLYKAAAGDTAAVDVICKLNTSTHLARQARNENPGAFYPVTSH